MITYNHERFIKEAIQGVLNQKVNFDFEFIISNDSSSDNTNFYIQRIINANPQVHFKYFNHSKNKGMIDNFLFALKSCSGKYIALCEGDDYWTDSLKLQKQVNFLEAHPDYEMCFTNIIVVNASGERIKENLKVHSQKHSFTHKDMTVWAPTLTRVFKNRDFSVLNKPSPGMDTLMLVYQSTLGKIRFLDEITGAYRIHEGGVYNRKKLAQKIEHKIRTRVACLSFVEKEYKRKFAGKILKDLLELKNLDFKLYKKTRSFILSEIAVINDMPQIRYFNFLICFSCVRLPIIFTSPSAINIIKKVINRLLIY